MRSRAAVSLALLVFLVLAPVGAASAAATVGGTPPAAAAVGDSSPLNPTADPVLTDAVQNADPGVVMRVNVTADGDARWTIEFREHLDSENETRAFREYRDAIVNGEDRPPITAREFSRYVNDSDAMTDREMALEDVEYGGRIENDTGVITVSFTWTNFAKVEDGGDRIVVGDAFNGTGGTWLPSLDAGQRLVINAPDGYLPYTAPRGHENGTIRWDGPYDFADNEITIGYSAQNGGTGPSIDPDDPLPMALLGVGIAALVVAVGTGGYLLARRQTEVGGDAPVRSHPETTTTDHIEEPTAAAATETVDENDEEDDAAESPDEDDEIDETLLSDEERVTRLLEANGGRMKQANIVKETGWSNAKVSQLLSSMDEDDQIDKLRIGRENLITLPDTDIGDDE
ncbi:hypothetical protein G9464_03740 [Halostella sp. JP-L12]|uniref:helix-turn-helix transcriptional regulator n=1 Tax=Halostella TaxID=1843185 RepID=UPI000EF7C654|nr:MULTISPECIES: hypothetical protein [Halostella]NHN46708.1 hypothetical protein [Halostella sp. JP-L12]